MSEATSDKTSKRLEAFEKMIELGTTDPFVFYARAMELRSLGRLADALARYGEVAEAFPDYIPTYLMAAQVSVELEQEELGLTWCKRGVEAARRVGDGHALGELEALMSELE